ncbi:ABC transporter permease [Bacteroidota bacterium]
MRNKAFSAINLSGLAIAFACSIIILLWIQNELSYDNFHPDKNEICQLLIHPEGSDFYQEFVHGPLAASLKDKFPEIKNCSRIYPLFPINKNPLRYGLNSHVLRGNVVDSSFFDIFNFPLIKGDKNTALSNPESIIITEETAIKLFGDEDPVGKTLEFELWHSWNPATVSAVVHNIPSNSSLQFDFLITTTLMQRFRPSLNTWDDIFSPAYILLQKNISYQGVEKKISNIIDDYKPEAKFTTHLHPLSKKHLYKYSGGGKISYIYIFAFLGVLIIIIACINYVNLALSRSIKRSREVAIRKVNGAKIKQLILQFLGESILSSFIALNFGILLAVILLPFINNLLDTAYQLQYSFIMVMGLISLGLFIGIFSGIYPAFIISRHHPVRALKGEIKSGSKSLRLKTILVLSQYIISIFLIICSLTIHRQLMLLNNFDLGFNKKNIINLEMRGDFFQNQQLIKKELLQNPNILNVSIAHTSFTSSEKGTRINEWEGKNLDGYVYAEIHPVDYDYLKTFEMKILTGRFFDEEYSTDELEGIILNESAVKAFKMEDPLGKWIKLFVGDEPRQAKVIGVIRNFNYRSLHNEIKPLVFVMAPWWNNELYLKINSGLNDRTRLIEFICTTIKKHVPDYPFQYNFVEDEINELYSTEKRAANLINLGTIIGVIIACLGLIGLIMYSAEQRLREMSIRKILGASGSDLFLLLGIKLFKWSIIANIIAWPVAYIIIKAWLQNFEYKTSLSVWIFLLAGSVSIILSFFAVSFQIIKTIRKNPVDTLRYE